ncbi:fatty acid desaturase [Shimia ponticola]|uniref:fatty acid desaturase n=1 Tax=Shimia ponticola TaxID=2582893 RepID=UPI0011BE4EF0|nr:fatty acid desaturase [Shimia ponticola]
MDHKALIASLPPEERAALTRRSDAAGLLHLAGHLGLIALGAVWISAGWPLWWLMLLPYGVVLVFLFTLAHEATHKTPFATDWMNELAGHLAGLVLILPFEWFRRFHMAHHRFTNDPERDPELVGPKPDTWPAFLWHVSGVPYWRAMMRQVWMNAFGRIEADYLSDRIAPRIRTEARVYLAIYVLLGLTLIWSPLVLWLWVVPVLLGQPFLRLYLLAEHGRCPAVANMLENSRTTYTNRVVRFLAWNMPYHAEHHAYPMVPFHQLPAFHERTIAHLLSTSEGYRQFAAQYASDLK